MKTKKLFLIPLATFCLMIGGCDFGGDNNNDNTSTSTSTYSIPHPTTTTTAIPDDEFFITSDATEKTVTEGGTTFTLTISRNSVLNKHDIQNIVWSSSDPNATSFRVVTTSNNFRNCSWTVTFSKIGEYDIYATIDELKSNTIKLAVSLSDDEIIAKLKAILDVTGGVRFGETYDIGLTANTVKKYSLGNCDGVLRFTEEGKLEVIGMDASKLSLKKNGMELEKMYFSVGHSILCTNIKGELIKQNVIQNQASKVTNDMLVNVTKLSLSQNLQNDTGCVVGLKYLTNLEEIDLSHNDLTDVGWLENLEKLKSINLSYNKIENFDQIVDNQELEYLDISNNLVNDISKIKFMQKISYLDLSNNNISDISDVSTSYSLESLFLNNNHLTVFTDKLSGLSNLTKLGVGHCNIPFTDIRSLDYLPNLTYLDISGTNPDLTTISRLTNLKQLYLNDCELKGKNIAILNDLVNLELLDISNNDLLKTDYNNALDGEKLTKIKHLMIGGNSFGNLPDLSKFSGLEILDITDSYDLTDTSSLSGLPIKTLILDYSNSINSEIFTSIINSLPNLEKLSIVDGFNYMNETLFNTLMQKVNNNELSLRFIDERWIDSSTIYNYSSCVFFDLGSFLSSCTVELDGSYTIGTDEDNKQVILSLINEDPSICLQHYKFNIHKSLYRFDIYGYQTKSYDMIFNVESRKTSSFTLALHDFVDVSTAKSSIINAEDDSKLIIDAYGKCELNGTASSYMSEKAAVPTIQAHDVTFECPRNKRNSWDPDRSSSLTIRGADGQAKNGVFSGGVAINANDVQVRNCDLTVLGGVGENSAKVRVNGSSGGNGINCSGFTAFKSKVSISGGKGGDGHVGKRADDIFTNNAAPGSNGGNGGTALYCDSFRVAKSTIKLYGGAAGNGGDGHAGEGLGLPSNGTSGGNGGNGGNALSVVTSPDIDRDSSVSYVAGVHGNGGKGKSGSTFASSSGSDGRDGTDGEKIHSLS